MTAAMADAITSVLPDIQDVSLSDDVTIDHSQYAQIMRGIDDNSATPVSAFNSSI
jgi:hypothetical protein